MIAVPTKYTKRTALKLAKKFYLKYQKEKNDDYKYLDEKFNKIPSHNKIVKRTINYSDIFYSYDKSTEYECWLIALTENQRRFADEKFRSEKATKKIRIKRKKAFKRLLDIVLKKRMEIKND